MLHENPWPEFSAKDFNKTSHLLHMCIQVIGKLMLTRPFDPHWANLAMPLTSRGFTTGVIPFGSGSFSVDINCMDHTIICTSSSGKQARIPLDSTSVAILTNQILKALKDIGITITINQQPQEVSHPIPFEQDTAPRIYDKKAVTTWWRIMLSTYCVLMKYHAKFYGITPSIGLFWGTLDLRDARYKGIHLPMKKANFITRNAMDDAQFEVGWTASNEKYPIPSFFAFAYPKPSDLENAALQPRAAKWIPAIQEFVLDYEDLRTSKNPEQDLLSFFESSYQAFALLDKWNLNWNVPGKAT